MAKKILIVLVVLVAAGATFFYLMRPVALVVKAYSGTAIKAVPGSVTVQAKITMELKSEVGGRIVKSDLEPGQEVREGDVLCHLDTGDVELEITSIKDNLETAREKLAIGSNIALQLASAQDDLANFERLAAAGNYSQTDLKKQERGVEQIKRELALEKVTNEQNLESLQNQLKMKQRQLDKMTIRAPFDGQVAEVYAHPGDLIAPGASIAQLISNQRRVVANISEENFADLKVGEKASVRFLPYGDQLYDAAVTQILPTADPQTQRYQAYLDVQIDHAKLVPGITGEVTIVVGERYAKTKIPRLALLGNRVFVVQDGRINAREVKTGYVSLTTVEILEGLQPGDEVIVDDLDQYRDGERVRAELVTRQTGESAAGS